MKNQIATQELPIRGYKVADSTGRCRGHLFEVGKEYTHSGNIKICSEGYHFCLKASHCFSYYSFNSNNTVFEVEAIGEYQTHEADSKICTSHIRIVRQLDWSEVLTVANEGKDNTGHSNSGNSNSGDWNSGNRNSGDRNSGNRNSGNSNSGNWNSGYRNSGNWNSGNWNSGDRNSGYSNSGDRNSGAFCTIKLPFTLFNKKCKMTEEEFINSKAYQLMQNNVDIYIWIRESVMTDQEKLDNPKYKTTEGYLKTIPFKEAFRNAWGNWTIDNKKAFTTLENFDWKLFTEITGIEKEAL